MDYSKTNGYTAKSIIMDDTINYIILEYYYIYKIIGLLDIYYCIIILYYYN